MLQNLKMTIYFLYKISFKTLNESPEGEDVYPDITFCFTEYRSGDHIYNCSYLQEHHSLSACQYQNLLLGESTAWSTIPNPGRVADVNFEEASMDLKELIPQHKVVTHFGRTDSLNSQMELIDKQFQLPGMICFTRTFGTYLKKGDVLVSESFLVILPVYIKSKLQIFIHIKIYFCNSFLIYYQFLSIFFKNLKLKLDLELNI